MKNVSYGAYQSLSRDVYSLQGIFKRANPTKVSSWRNTNQ